MSDQTWNGVEGSTCEHRTVGYRAWCHDCQEWCYPDTPCLRCTKPDERIAALEAENRQLAARAALYEEALQEIVGIPGSRTNPWEAIDIARNAQKNARALTTDAPAEGGAS